MIITFSAQFNIVILQRYYLKDNTEN